jgi:hypothetical protein
MPEADDWVELFTVERPPEQVDDRRVVAVQLAVRGFDMDRDIDPEDVRTDLLCGRGGDLRAWLARPVDVAGQPVPALVDRAVGLPQAGPGRSPSAASRRS